MPSPFPGMDPYLEDPARWSGVHHSLISAIRDILLDLLRPRYFVGAEERVYLANRAEMDRVLGIRVPDVEIAAGPARFAPGGGGAVALEEPLVMMTWLEEVREAYLTIRDSKSREVVAVIEVLSPTNKLPGSPGWESFEQKRREVMESPTHWVEIDLLRQGRSWTRSLLDRPCEYLVHVSPEPMRPEGKVWPIRLDRALPTITVPLKPDEHDCPLDLQAVVTAVYHRGYDFDTDYSVDPVPPLDSPWAEWADRLLREKGLR